MRITFVLPTKDLSGGTRVAVIYAERLMRAGHSVRLVYPPPQPQSFRRKLKHLLVGKGWTKSTRHLPSHLDGSTIDHYELESWRPVIDQDVPDADVVIATWWETAEWVYALSPNKGAKVYFIQGHEIFDGLPKDRVRDTYYFPMRKIVISQWLKNIMLSEYGDPSVELVPNSVDHDQFFAEPRSKQTVPTVGFIYASASSKRADLSIMTLRGLRNQFPNLRIISFGSEYPTKNLKLPEGSQFFYYPQQADIRHLYEQCDVWLTASKSEGFNLSAMEAMACRTPVVSTKTGWPEEAIKTGFNGFLAGVDDNSALAEGVSWILSLSDSDWRNLSTNAFATVEKSSWSASAKLFEAALVRACESQSVSLKPC